MTDAQPARYCPYCGAPVPGGPRYCFGCGGEQPGHEPAASTGRLSRPGRPWSLVLAGAAVVVLVLATVPLLISRWLPDSPEDVARAYFDALAERDADKALALLEPTADKPADSPMLTDRILNDPGYTPPGEVKAEVLFSATDSSTVKVDYHINQVSGRLELTLTRRDDRAGWKIRNGLLPMALPRNDAGWVTFLVAGAAVPATQERLDVVFPGAYRIVAAGNGIQEAPPISVWAGAGETDPLLVRLRPKVREAIEPQVRAYLDTCAESHELLPSGCPFDGRSDRPVTGINWTITHYPTLQVQLTSTGTEARVVGEAGEAEVTGRTASPTTPDFAYRTTFSVSGFVRVTDGKLVFVPNR